MEGVSGMSMVVVGALAGIAVALAAAVYAVIRRKNIHIWLPAYIKQCLTPRPRVRGPRHVLFCFVDHFEPQWRRPPFATAMQRVETWAQRYPALARAHRDADGYHPSHTFFFPEEEYHPAYLDALTGICRQGLGEIEIHLHHDHDTADGFRAKLERFKEILDEHDALPRDAQGRGRYAFIHGNWCLDNAKPDGRWCGVNNEIDILAKTGCYADFTLPAAPDPAQTRQINSIYYAVDDPEKPKSHDRGVRARVGGGQAGQLMLIQGVLGLNWKRRAHGIFPRIENSDISLRNPPLPARVDQWVNTGVGVVGRPEWVFIKVHTHGASEADFETLLGEPMDAMFSYLETRYNDGRDYVLHYVSAREMYNIARAAEDGKRGNPHEYRDYEIRRPQYRLAQRPAYANVVTLPLRAGKDSAAVVEGPAKMS